mmetsp:Transcript_4862/g.9632  ORF Transcript_4862/g.9632 Transcript_4862/m.9632 type:complete len:87 (+) Transcript_4862:953-1213(+)
MLAKIKHTSHWKRKNDDESTRFEHTYNIDEYSAISHFHIGKKFTYSQGNARNDDMFHRGHVLHRNVSEQPFPKRIQPAHFIRDEEG